MDLVGECVIRGACPSTHSHVNSVLVLLSNIIIHHQNYHDITNFTNLTMFTLYKILKASILSINTQIMTWHNKDSGSKNLPPPPKVATLGHGPCWSMRKYSPAWDSWLASPGSQMRVIWQIITSSGCSAKGQVFHCKLRHPRLHFCPKTGLPQKLGYQVCSFNRDE